MKIGQKWNLHVASNEDGMYFWDRVDFARVQKAIVVLAIIMVCLPVFVR